MNIFPNILVKALTISDINMMTNKMHSKIKVIVATLVVVVTMIPVMTATMVATTAIFGM